MDRAYDLIVVGTGAAGMTAAIVAQSRGFSVLLLEKTDQVGGTSAVSGGACWVPCNHFQKAQGVEDSFERAMTYLDNVVGTDVGREQREVYLRRAPEAVKYLEDVSELTMPARPFTPDYQSDVEGAQNHGRVMVTKNFDGSLLGERFNDLRPPHPENCLFGTAMVDGPDLMHLLKARRSPRSAWHSLKFIINHAIDRLKHPGYRRGSRLTTGNAMVARLYKSVLDRGISVVMGAHVDDLLVENGAAAGVLLSRPHKAKIRARHGVVLATGGFPGNLSMRRKYLPEAASGDFSAAPSDNTGDGISLALAHDAQFDTRNLNGAFWCPTSTGKRADGSTFHFPHLIGDRVKPGLIAVDRHGKRFVNESDAYHLFVQAMMAGDHIPAYLVCDARFMRRFPFGVARPLPFQTSKHLRSGYLFKGRTIEKLAAAIGVDPVALRETIERFNKDARAGVDRQFARGSTLYHRNLGDPDNKPNPSLRPLEHGPYYAIRIDPGDIGTIHGLSTDSDCRVMDDQGHVIEGLYACGNDRASVMGGAYPAGGITLGPAVTSGYLAAMHAAGKAGNALKVSKTTGNPSATAPSRRHA